MHMVGQENQGWTLEPAGDSHGGRRSTGTEQHRAGALWAAKSPEGLWGGEAGKGLGAREQTVLLAGPTWESPLFDKS